jgi:hypothetical protein
MTREQELFDRMVSARWEVTAKAEVLAVYIQSGSGGAAKTVAEQDLVNAVDKYDSAYREWADEAISCVRP